MSRTVSQADGRYERRDVDFLAMTLLVLLMVICGGLVHLAVAGFLTVLNQQIAPPRSERPQLASSELFPSPRLQLTPRHDLATMRQREESLLHGYGWVDRNKGTVRIPIDRAMELLVQRGLPKTATNLRPQELQQKRPEQNASRPSEFEGLPK
jgi:hypothetical protein